MRQTTLSPLVGLVLLATIGWTAGARATTVHPFSLDELIYVADRIVVGQVLTTEARFTPDGGAIVTTVELQVDQVLKGAPVDGVLDVRVLGGETGGFALHVEGAPRFDAGERTLLFLEDGVYGPEVLGWAQGKLQLEWNPDAGETFAHRRVVVGEDTAADWMPAEGLSAAALTDTIRLRVRAGHVPPYRDIPGLQPHKQAAFRDHWGLGVDR
ncbi:MAG: hypothetical protein QGH45_24360 [Myxococcota bacterium]|jgi:hypothetical protein|nr:hypothetical protein [Myxococcota bacterium]